MYRLLLIMPIGFFALIALILISRGEYHPATGCCILSAFFIFVLGWSLIRPSKKTPAGKRSHEMSGQVTIHEGKDLVLLYKSKDIVRIAQIEEALRVRGIDCNVLDSHGSVMMSFIPEIEMRIMVPQEDYEWSVRILRELLQP